MNRPPQIKPSSLPTLVGASTLALLAACTAFSDLDALAPDGQASSDADAPDAQDDPQDIGDATVPPDCPEPNACGGCAALEALPGEPCQQCGVWACDGADAVRCTPGRRGACDDGDPCTEDEACVRGQCLGHNACVRACADGCSGQSCPQEGCCEGECRGGACACAQGCTCELECTGAGCAHLCPPGSACRLEGNEVRDILIECIGSLCQGDYDEFTGVEMICRDGADCEMRCRDGANCEMTCSGGARGLLECDDVAGCGLECEGESLFCGEGIFTCNRPCP